MALHKIIGLIINNLHNFYDKDIKMH